MKSKLKKMIIGLVVLALLVGGMLFAYNKLGPKSSDIQKGSKKITILVEHGNKETKTFVYQTDEEFLGALLTEKKLVEGSTSKEFGLMITTVDSEKADDTKQQWWAISKSKEMLMTGVDATPIKDGDTFELTMTEGY